MAKRNRSADYVTTLIYLDEPQLILLKTKTVHMLAIAIPSENAANAPFLATTVTERNFELYMDGHVDLRYIFTYPRDRFMYEFDLMKMKDNKIITRPFDGEIPENYLPSPRLFSADHTETYEFFKSPTGKEKLFIDGEWGMPEFGQFYQKYADIYAFSGSMLNWRDPNKSEKQKQSIEDTFRDRAFEGGFSYVHFFHGLNDNIPREEKAALDRIQYASPGEVEILGKEEIFDRVEFLIENFLENRKIIGAAYLEFYRFLSKNKYLKLSGQHFDLDDPMAPFIESKAKELADLLGDIDFEAVKILAQKNALVLAKIVLALTRRIESAASFFAQGRMNYSD